MLTLSGQTKGAAPAERGLPEARGVEVRGLDARRAGEPLGELSAEATRAAGRGRDAGCDACGGAAPKARCAKRGR